MSRIARPLKTAAALTAIAAVCVITATAGVPNAQLLKDIATAPNAAGSEPGGITVAGNIIYFTANDPVHGRRLWKSDGTPGGTAILPEIPSHAVSDLAAVGDTLFFTARGYPATTQLWRTGGPSPGTLMLREYASERTDDPPFVGSLTPAPGQLFFVADDLLTGKELWKSDGTPAGTVMVRELFTGPGQFGPNDAWPEQLVEMGSRLYFVATDETHGRELWKSDGTSAGTQLVSDTNPGTASNYIEKIIAAGDRIYYVVNNSNLILPKQLWTSDGTAPGTRHLATNFGGDGAFAEPTPLGTGLVYRSGCQLGRSDGTVAGTGLIRDFAFGTGCPYQFFTMNGSAWFFSGGLWKTDGTDAGTRRVTDLLLAGASSYGYPDYAIIGNTVFFRGGLNWNDFELWKSDGTAAGTVIVREINSGGSGMSSMWSSLKAAGNMVYFTANDGENGEEVWKSDGTAEGTVMVKNIVSGTINSLGTGDDWFSSYARRVPDSVVNGRVFFAAADDAHGMELWITDGTAAGTRMVKDILSGPGNSTVFSSVNHMAMGNMMFFPADDGTSGSELWKSDGTESGTVIVKDIHPGGSGSPTNLTVIGNTLFFLASQPASGRELWKSDGTEEGTVMVKDIRPGSFSTFDGVEMFGVIEGVIYFAVDDGVHGNELWKSDGTADGTVMVKDVTAGADSSYPARLTVAGRTLYFWIRDAAELWKSDGTADGTVLVRDGFHGCDTYDECVNRYYSSYVPHGKVDSTVYFPASDGIHGLELWKSDGTEAGTVMVRDIAAGRTSSFPDWFTTWGGMLYFSATDGGSGHELWRSDGTPGGTVRVSDIRPGAGSSNPRNLFAAGGLLCFLADNGFHGVEAWASDGTADGTAMIADPTGDFGTSSPDWLGTAGDRLVFAATTLEHGREPWVFNIRQPRLGPLTSTAAGAGAVSFHGIVSPSGLPTTVRLEYGLTTAYGSTAPLVLSPNDGTTAQSVVLGLSGLAPGAMYHCRLVAENAAGTVSTDDLTFRSPATALEAWRLLHFGIPDDSAAAADDADPDGDAQPNRMEYLAGTNPNQPHSAFSLTAARLATDELALRFSPVRPGVRYTVQSGDGLSAWLDGSVMTFENPTPSAQIIVPGPGMTASRFFRVRLEEEP